MFFESALKGRNGFWRYLVMFIVVFAATNIIGAIPLIVVVIIQGVRNPEILDSGSDNLADLSAFGIEPNLGFILMLVPFIIGIITLLLLIKPLNGRSFISLFNGGGKIRWNKFAMSTFIWLILMGVYLYFSIQSDPGNFRLNNTTISLVWLIIIAVLLIPFQSSFEEILFRGYLMQGAGSWFGNKWMPLIITSVLFALMHSFNPEIKEFGFWIMMPQYIVFGLTFGLTTILDDGIEVAMGAHTANNMFLSIFITQESSALQTPALYEQQVVYPWSDLISLTLVSVVFIIIMGLLNKWSIKGIFKLKCD